MAEAKRRVRLLISYNPYTQETTVKTDSRNLAASNLLNAISICAPISSWVSKLPDLLDRQYGGRRLFIAFKGTGKDFEEIRRVLPQAGSSRDDQIVLKHYDMNDTDYKRLNGMEPDEEYAETDLSKTKNDLEICVIATMSAGKSTLINAILGTKLMPSTQEACTAIIVKIRDDDSYNAQGFAANVRNRNGELIERIENLTLNDMTFLNANKEVSSVEIVGDIECVPSDNISLVLVDTPGPNNARDQSHRKIQSDYLASMAPALVLFVLTGEFGNDDEYLLIQKVVKVISSGDKRDEDRFLFVLNKVDERKREDGTLENTLIELKRYLQNHGIQNPRIFPVSALLALQIRRMLNIDPDFIEEDQDETTMKIRKFNRSPQLHLEKYAPEFSDLPKAITAKLINEAINAENEWIAKGGAKYQSPHAALIHSGIPVLESVFMDYIRKYAIKHVYISHNPFTRSTEVRINNEAIAEKSWFNKLNGLPLQAWVDKMPEMLKKETRTDMFGIKFHGIPLDFEDISDVVNNPLKKIHMAYLKFLPPHYSNEIAKPQRIERLFNNIQSSYCPFPQLKSQDIKNAFNKAKTPLLHVLVISPTASTGKSTVVNALLEQELLPSNTRAITLIRDNDEMVGKPFQAHIYRDDSDVPEYINILDANILTSLNQDKHVRQIHAEGEVAFVESTLVSMVVADTPPNHGDPEDFQELEKMLYDPYNKPFILYILAENFDNAENAALISKLANNLKDDEMGEAKYRLLFVVNKLDLRKQGDGSIKDLLASIERFLVEKGIEYPHILPIAALPALRIKKFINYPEEIRDLELKELNALCSYINRRMHLDKQHKLPKLISRELDSKLKELKSAWGKTHQNDDKTNPEEALIHTGLSALEAIIRQYVEKYTYPQIIRDLCTTLMAKVSPLEEETIVALKANEEVEKTAEAQKNIAWIRIIKEEIDKILSI